MIFSQVETVTVPFYVNFLIPIVFGIMYLCTTRDNIVWPTLTILFLTMNQVYLAWDWCIPPGIAGVLPGIPSSPPGIPPIPPGNPRIPPRIPSPPPGIPPIPPGIPLIPPGIPPIPPGIPDIFLHGKWWKHTEVQFVIDSCSLISQSNYLNNSNKDCD